MLRKYDTTRGVLADGKSSVCGAHPGRPPVRLADKPVLEIQALEQQHQQIMISEATSAASGLKEDPDPSRPDTRAMIHGTPLVVAV